VANRCVNVTKKILIVGSADQRFQMRAEDFLHIGPCLLQISTRGPKSTAHIILQMKPCIFTKSSISVVPQSSPHRLLPRTSPAAAPRRVAPGCTPAPVPIGGSWRRRHSFPPSTPLALVPPSSRPTAPARILRPPEPPPVCYHRCAAPCPTAPTRIRLLRHPQLPRPPNVEHMPFRRPALCFVKSISGSSLPLFFFILFCIFLVHPNVVEPPASFALAC
jgi:hypothetical protein